VFLEKRAEALADQKSGTICRRLPPVGTREEVAMPTACEICGQSPEEQGITVYRVNPTGVPGVWRCAMCLTTPIDPDLAEIVAILEEGQAGAEGR
jgi:hypothetical protein